MTTRPAVTHESPEDPAETARWEAEKRADRDEELLAQAIRSQERAADSDPDSGKHRVLASRTWADDYPDEVTVSVQVSDDEGRAFVVIGAAAVWLRPDQVTEMLDWLARCRELVLEYNGGHR